MGMKINSAVVDKICGVALVILCVVFAIFSIKVCDGDITPVFVLAPMGVCGMMKTVRHAN